MVPACSQFTSYAHGSSTDAPTSQSWRRCRQIASISSISPPPVLSNRKYEVIWGTETEVRHRRSPMETSEGGSPVATAPGVCPLVASRRVRHGSWTLSGSRPLTLSEGQRANSGTLPAAEGACGFSPRSEPDQARRRCRAQGVASTGQHPGASSRPWEPEA